MLIINVFFEEKKFWYYSAVVRELVYEIPHWSVPDSA
jgi:hypothetical protein